MNKVESQKDSIEASKQKGIKKKYEDYSAEELDAMDPDEEADLQAQAIVESLNDPDNHDKSN